MVSTNATAQGVRNALLPFSTSLTDTEIEEKIDYVAELVNGMLGTEYTTTTEPTSIRMAIELYTAYHIIMTVFFDEKLNGIDWKFNDITIEHATDAYVIRDLAYELKNMAFSLLGAHGRKTPKAYSYKTYPAGLSGQTNEGLDDDQVDIYVES